MSAFDKLRGAVTALRKDGWQNPLSGLGTRSRDRAKGLEFVPACSLTLTELQELFRGDDICRKVVSIFPDEALRLGFCLPDPAAKARCDALDVRGKAQEAATWGRLYGGGLIVMTTDAIDASVPLEPAPNVRCLDVYDRIDVQYGQTETDPRSPWYGRARTFRVTVLSGAQIEIHRSRCVVFGGALTGRRARQANGGWDDSVLEVVIETVRAFNSGFLSLDNLLTDASTGVLKMSGVVSSLGSKDGKATLETRAQLFDLMRNVTRSLFLDADENESYEKVSTSFTGLAEVIDRLGQRVSAATEIPITKLVGTTSNGIGATGEGDRLNWIDTVTAYRSHKLEPGLRTLVGYIAPGQEALITWPPLWTPTAKEAAELRQLRMTTATGYVQNEVLRPEALTDSAAADLGLPAQELPEPAPPLDEDPLVG